MSTKVRQRPRVSAREVARQAEAMHGDLVAQRRQRHQTLDLLSSVLLLHGGAIDLRMGDDGDDPRLFPVDVDIDHEAKVVRLRSRGYSRKRTLRQRIASRLL